MHTNQQAAGYLEQMKTDISIIIPVYDEQKNVELIYWQLKNVLNTLPLKSEIIFVDDGSKDATAQKIQSIIQNDKKTRLIQLRRNFGKSDALSAGFKEAKGNIIITMDGDLQDDPQEIPRFIEKIQQGYDLVSGWKFHRKDPITKTIPSKIFNKMARLITSVRIHDMNCGYKAYTQELAKTIKVYGELHRYIPALAQWNGFKVGEIKVTHHPRKHGKSKYGTSRIIKGLLDLITITYLTTYLKRPLHLFGTAGIIGISIGTLIGLILAYLNLAHNIIIVRPALFLAVLLILIGLQLFSTGLIAEMITHTRPEQTESKILIKR